MRALFLWKLSCPLCELRKASLERWLHFNFSKVHLGVISSLSTALYSFRFFPRHLDASCRHYYQKFVDFFPQFCSSRLQKFFSSSDIMNYFLQCTLASPSHHFLDSWRDEKRRQEKVPPLLKVKKFFWPV